MAWTGASEIHEWPKLAADARLRVHHPDDRLALGVAGARCPAGQIEDAEPWAAILRSPRQ